MKEFKDRVAVITGAASGIGRAIADRCVAEGMKVVLADIDKDSLVQLENEFKSTGATVLAVPTDVTKASDIDVLAQKTLDTFGAVHLLFNNAGVAMVSPDTIWESTLQDWEWIMGVNVWGVIHGVHKFVPLMLKQETEGHIINTASISGITYGSSVGTYRVSKHAVVALSETLYSELAQKGAKLKVTVVCPGYANTQLLEAERNRPVELQNEIPDELGSELEQLKQTFQERIQMGVSPEEVAEKVFDAIQNEQFYVFTQFEEFRHVIQERMESILQHHNPKTP